MSSTAIALPKKKTTGMDLSAFQTIVDFVENLFDFFGSTKHPSSRSLSLYHRLITKMSFNEEDLILRHVGIFRSFCVANRKSIRAQSLPLEVSTIKFTDKIFIDMDYFFKKADDDAKLVMWQYILAVSAFLDPQSNAKDLLKKLKVEDTSNEGEFLSSMLETIGSSMMSGGGGGDVNPMEMVGQLMNSDMLSNLMGMMNGKMEDGNLDMGKLLNSVNGIVDTVKAEISKSDDPMIKNMMTMIDTSLAQIGGLQTPSVQEEK